MFIVYVLYLMVLNNQFVSRGTKVLYIIIKFMNIYLNFRYFISRQKMMNEIEDGADFPASPNKAE